MLTYSEPPQRGLLSVASLLRTRKAGPDHWWPPGVSRKGDPMACLVALFESVGYEACADGAYVEGVEKIAIYAKPWGPTHAAKQIGPGKWASKLGNWYDIEHAEKAVSGGDYGEVVRYMERPRKG
jgi:hypothetical protein